MPCPKCGAPTDAQANFCAACGELLLKLQKLTPTPSVQPPPYARRNRIGWLLVGLIIAAGVIALIYFAPTPDQPAVAIVDRRSESPTPQPSNNQLNPPPAASVSAGEKSNSGNLQNPPTYQIGQKFTVGRWTYMCNRAFWTSYLLGTNPFLPVPSDAAYLVIDITAENDGTEPMVLIHPALTDEQEATYEEAFPDQAARGFLGKGESFNPHVAERGMIAYHVVPDRPYRLMFFDLNANSKVAAAIVDLPPAPKSDPSQQQQQPQQ